MHGAKITAPDAKVENKEEAFMFKDPEEYKHLSDEEKKQLTEKMKGAHKMWSSGRRQLGKVDG